MERAAAVKPAAVKHPAVKHGVLPVILGGLVYLGFRPSTLLFFGMADAVGLRPVAIAARHAIRALVPTPPDFIVYVLPDALWTYALSYWVASLTRSMGRRERALWFLVPVLMGPGAELLQAFGLLPGTFDPIDLVACVASIALGWLAASWVARTKDAEPAKQGAQQTAAQARKIAAPTDALTA